MDDPAVRELLSCYARGVFPMAEARNDPRIFLVDPEARGVIPLERFHISRSLARAVRQDRFEVRVDTAFDAVVAGCAAPRPGHPETWINTPIATLYGRMHAAGFAHCVETWRDGELVGGIYGVALGGAFFGESMFSRATDASKVALVHLVARLIAGGFVLFDAQFVNPHLTQFGIEEIPRRAFHQRLEAALAREADFYRLTGATAGAAALQLITQAS